MRVPFGEQLLLGVVDLAEQLAIELAVLDADRRRALMHGMFEEVRRAVLAVALRQRAEPILEGRGDARDAMVLDEDDPEAVVEDELVRIEPERGPVLRVDCGSTLGAERRAVAAGRERERHGDRETDGDETRHGGSCVDRLT